MRHHPLPITPWQRFFYIVLPVVSFLLILALANTTPEAFDRLAGGEDGVLEIAHIVLTVSGFVIAIRLILHFMRLGNRWGILFSTFSALVCLYIAGEEASYGQHFFGWETDGFFLERNDQQESNFHNTSSWLDQKPRALLEITIILGGLILPLFPRLMMRFVPAGLRPYSPTLLFLSTSLLVVLSRLPERLNFEGLLLFPDGVRYSEIQELYLFLFIALYLYFVLRLERHKQLSL